MTEMLSDADRAVFAGVADVLIPAAAGMPSASDVGVQHAPADHVLSLRPELWPDLRRALGKAAGVPPAEAADGLNRDDPAALQAIGTIAAAAYYMDPGVRDRLGYPGQESRPVMPEEEGDYLEDGLLQAVIDRGPIYRPTPEDK